MSGYNSPFSMYSASSRAKYVMIISAPARAVDTADSHAIFFSFSQPIEAAAFIMEYSPLTQYDATGTFTRSLTARRTSRYGKPGFTMIISAPSAMSSSASLTASRTFLGFIWYDFLSPNDGADPAASLNGP